MRTVVFSFTISSLICLAFIVALWSKNRHRYRGLGFWVIDFLLQFLALTLVSLRGRVPDLLSMTGSNAMAVAGTLLLLIGLERFTEKRGFHLHNVALLIAFTLANAFFVVVKPDLGARNILLSAAILVLSVHAAWLLFKRVPKEMRRIASGVGGVMLGFAAHSFLRILVELFAPSGNDFFHSPGYETLIFMVYQMLSLALTFSLSLMVNLRLIQEQEEDIAARKRTARLLGIRLDLWEYAADHHLKELMVKALDEIEGLTDSRIGFYHFVDEDHGTLTLQAWSTATRSSYCKAEGEDSHYPIAQAGVWVECVRTRRPVVHNDYASLTNKRGLPPGHALLVRELVVPTMRGGKVVSILGVGNKPTEYSQEDEAVVSYIADLVWTIVTQKRSDEQIVKLNERLERMALTDELTGLPNRRCFQQRGDEELRKGRRYGAALALVMLDLDLFKEVNDTYGHDAGDAVLKRVALTIRENIRDVDLGARLGGEEFAVLLPHTTTEEAAVFAERLRSSIEAKPCVFGENEITMTASLGVASCSGSEDSGCLDALLKKADTAMYEAKRMGRNRVICLG